MALHVFVDADDAYLAWTASCEAGYVLNTTRVPSASYLVLHRSNCWSIRNLTGNRRSWTTAYAKVCAEQRREIEHWLATNISNGSLHECALLHRLT